MKKQPYTSWHAKTDTCKNLGKIIFKCIQMSRIYFLLNLTLPLCEGLPKSSTGVYLEFQMSGPIPRLTCHCYCESTCVWIPCPICKCICDRCRPKSKCTPRCMWFCALQPCVLVVCSCWCCPRSCSLSAASRSLNCLTCRTTHYYWICCVL